MYTIPHSSAPTVIILTTILGILYIFLFHLLEYGLLHVDLLFVTLPQTGRQAGESAVGCDLRHAVANHLLQELPVSLQLQQVLLH